LKSRVRGLAELARLYGVEQSYEAMDGRRNRSDAEAVMATLRALGAALDDVSDATSALAERRAELDALAIQPILVAWDGALPQLRVRLPQRLEERAAVEILLESGERISQPCRAERADLPARRGWQSTHVLRVGQRLPLGYHQLQVETSGATLESLIIAAPRHAFAPDATRAWGVFFPLYAVHSADSWGTGDYTDLGRAARWVRELDGDFVSTLPMLATFLDAPFEPSPYAPASRLFWSELFIDVTAVPGWSADPAALARAAEYRTGELIDYREVASLKRRELERILRDTADDPAVAAGLRQFAAAHDRADDYARFRAVCDRRREGWPVWPARMRRGEIRAGDFAPEDRDYHLFAQWQADAQLAALGADDRAAALYLDMPLGVHSDSYDCWRFGDVFAEGVSAGAPPDALFTGGQDWGFRPLQPSALRRSGYTYFIDSLRHHFRHARMLRLDHIMSLYRLFWVPHGLGPRRGVYVRYPEDELFAILVLESARHRAPVVGEDLGTVPHSVRRAMNRHRVHRMHVVQYEAVPDRKPPLRAPDENVVASLNTHDMPTWAGFWRGTEIDDQLDLHLIDPAGHHDALRDRALLRRAISADIGAGGEVGAALARQRLLERLAASTARYLVITLEDLWLEERPQNVPGTSAERPNWKRRASRTLDQIMADASIRRMLRAVADRRSKPPTFRPERYD
jgi:4-alpha-glucanotransferase